jgi:hypothetical protein
LPFLSAAFVGVAAYLICPALQSPLQVTAACGIIAFAADSVGAAVWALAQDLGGHRVAAALAWSNMWGNFGASGVAKIIPVILAASWHFADWREVFWVCASGFVVMALAICGVDSTRSLEPEQETAKTTC